MSRWKRVKVDCGYVHDEPPCWGGSDLAEYYRARAKRAERIIKALEAQHPEVRPLVKRMLKRSVWVPRPKPSTLGSITPEMIGTVCRIVQPDEAPESIPVIMRGQVESGE